MLEIDKKTNDDGSIVLTLAGDATVEFSEQLRESLLEALRGADSVSVVCKDVTSCDFFTMQMFCSAHRTSVKLKKQFIFAEAPSPAVIETVSSTGFKRKIACSLSNDPANCMWTDRINQTTD